jgi:hypothetical protein
MEARAVAEVEVEDVLGLKGDDRATSRRDCGSVLGVHSRRQE